APLQIVVADQLHVTGFCAVTAGRRLRRGRPGGERYQRQPEEDHRERSWPGRHGGLLSAWGVVTHTHTHGAAARGDDTARPVAVLTGSRRARSAHTERDIDR